MKKNLFYLFALVCSLSLFTACSDDDEPKTPEEPGVEEKDIATIIKENIAGDYKGELSVTVSGIPMGTVNQKISVDQSTANQEAIDLSISDFSFIGMSLGDINLNNCAITPEEDGTYTFPGTTTIEKEVIPGTVLTADVEAEGTFDANNSITLNLDITAMLGNTPQEVQVVFEGTKLTGSEGTEASILTFTFDNEAVTEQPVIDEENGIITFKVAEGTDATALVPTITVSEGATITPASGEAQDFSNGKAVTYTVVSEDYGVTKEYKVSISAEQSSMVFDLNEWEAVVFNPEVENNAYETYYQPLPRDILATPNEGATLLNMPVEEGAGDDVARPIGYPVVAEEEGYEGQAAKLITRDARKSLGAIMGAFITAGSLYTGEFAYSMSTAMSAPLTMTHFGIIYDKKPVTFKGVYKYTPGAPFIRTTGTGFTATSEETDEIDECAIQAVLYTVTSEDETLDGTNIDSDDARIVARARLEDGSAKEEWTPFELEFNWTGEYDPNKTYKLAIVCSASKEGANFNGAVNSTLIVDNLEIVGE